MEGADITGGVRQGCTASKCLFNIDIDGIMRDRKATLIHRRKITTRTLWLTLLRDETVLFKESYE